MPNPAAPRFVDRVEDLPTVSEIAALSGFEVMQGALTGGLPTPPICRTVGFRLAEVDEGRVVFEGAPEFRHYNVLGGAHEYSGRCAWRLVRSFARQLHGLRGAYTLAAR